MKKLILILLAFVITASLVSCKKCDHTYDNVCDAICNECNETRDVGAHDYAPADCDSPKTCKICGATDGEALGHSQGEDDGDCTTPITCTVCGVITTGAKEAHTPRADDGDCTTPITCSSCFTIIVAGTIHHYSTTYKSNADEHWVECINPNCNVPPLHQKHVPNQEAATETAPKKCIYCEYIIEPQVTHEHTYTVADYDDAYHYDRCACGVIDENTKETHKAISDNDCATPDLCSCGYTVTTAKDHEAGEDDGDCTTAIKCKNCEQMTTAGFTKHNDNNKDYLCDNPGCKEVLPRPTENESGSIDLPIDRN